MVKDKIHNILQENQYIYNRIKDKWNAFLEENTYLTHWSKKDLLKELDKCSKFPWYHRLVFSLSSKIANFKKGLDYLKSKIKNFNTDFVERRLEEYISFFDGKEYGIQYPLDENQRYAVIKDDKHNLVIAGAGSGKTSVITTRIAYLVNRKDKIERDRILALAFTRVAAQEMKERLLNSYGIDIDISTFHALGRKIILEAKEDPPKLLFEGSMRKKNQLIQKLFTNLLDNDDYQDLLVNYLSYHIDEELDKDFFEDKEEYYQYMRNKQYITFNDILVKSISEKNIGNFLFRNQVEFEYEPLVEWVDKEENQEIDDESKHEKQYHPDFYLPKYDIYIEHWGLNEQMEVPVWFTITSKEYCEIRQWKLSQFDIHKKKLVETWEYERINGNLIDNLKEKLSSMDEEVEFQPMNYCDLVEKVYELKENVNEIVRSIVSFIRIAKSNFLKVSDIKKRTDSRKYSKKQRLFGKIALEVYRKYQEYLENENKIDFNDMINHAVEIVKTNPDKYLDKYLHVLVDEFQDISNQRLELIKGFVNENSSTKLFCVGDDWQSIYQFTGSDVSFFVDFSDFFPNPEITQLDRNYRSSQNIVLLSNSLIAHNKYQVHKKVSAVKEVSVSPLLFKISQQLSNQSKVPLDMAFQLIRKLIEDGVKPPDIMVISRFNKRLKDLEIKCGAYGIPIKEPRAPRSIGIRFYSAHKSKGSESKHVILLDIISGLYGFPCEIQDSSVLDLARRNKTKSHIEEERRLFYVALTRSEKFLYIFTVENNESIFIDEISSSLISIYITSQKQWDLIMDTYIPVHLRNEFKTAKRPFFCQRCGRILMERSGKYGKFLSCSGYPDCDFSQNSIESGDILCPSCGKKLVPRSGKYGKFLGCIGYPNCKFIYNLNGKSKRKIYCPKCGNKLTLEGDEYKKRLICSKRSKCNFEYDFH